MRKVASEHPFCVLIYINSYIFHIYFILFIFLQNTYLIFDVISLILSLAGTHGIAKYARTYIRRCTHTHTKNIEKIGKKKKRKQKEDRRKKRKILSKKEKERNSWGGEGLGG